jgi:hypothetical protein
VNELSAQAGVNVLTGQWREEPGGAFEKIGIGKLHPSAFFACHGMPGEKSLPGVSPKRFRGALNNFRFRAADVSNESFRRQRRTEPSDQIEDRNHGRCQHHQIAAAHRIRGVGRSRIDGPASLSLLQNWSAIASNDSSGKPALLEREAQRASDQAGSDDGDLFEGHL